MSAEDPIILGDEAVELGDVVAHVGDVRRLTHVEALPHATLFVRAEDARRTQGLVRTDAQMTQGIDAEGECAVEGLTVDVLDAGAHQVVGVFDAVGPGQDRQVRLLVVHLRRHLRSALRVIDGQHQQLCPRRAGGV